MKGDRKGASEVGLCLVGGSGFDAGFVFDGVDGGPYGARDFRRSEEGSGFEYKWEARVAVCE